jgi:hypothetical protein
MKGSPSLGGYLIMSNWKYWYQNFTDSQNERIAEAFKKGLEGDYSPVTSEQKRSLSTWQDIRIASKNIDKNFNINFNETKLEFNNELLNLAYLKSFKNITSFSFYSPQFINKLFFYYLSDSNISFDQILNYLQDTPLGWFDTCPNCDYQNDDDWSICVSCRKTFDELLDL